MKLAFILVICAALSAGECISVAADKIVVRDLASAVPLFGSLDAETVIGFAPLPGVQRILSSRELLALARQQGLEAESTLPSVCVQRAVQSLEGAKLEAALMNALGIPDAHLELLGFSNQGVPAGRLEFSIGGLNKPPAGSPQTPVIWRGRLIYDAGRSLAVWAKVRITVQRSTVIAIEHIQAGAVIRREQVKARDAIEFPFSGAFVDSISRVVGRVARQNILAGQRISPALLAEPSSVLPGERVHVQVVDGLALLSLEAVAQSAGSKGDVILMHNPATGKSFRGVVEDKGKVVVRPSEGVE